MSDLDLLHFIDESKDFQAKTILDFANYIYEQNPSLDLGLDLSDCCGTGGDASNTFNISTSAAIIAAASGVKVAKNGGRASSSLAGSIDLLEALGINLDCPNEIKKIGLEKFNLAFYSSKVSARLLGRIKSLSKQFKKTSFLSLLGPICSPVKLKYQMIGIGREAWLETMLEIAENLIKNKLRTKILLIQSKVFDSNIILDEISSTSSSVIWEISPSETKKHFFDPRECSLSTGVFEDLTGKDPEYNAGLVKEILRNNDQLIGMKTCIQTVLLNTAFLIYLSEDQDKSVNFDISQYFIKAQEGLLNHKAENTLKNIIDLYCQDPNLC